VVTSLPIVDKQNGPRSGSAKRKRTAERETVPIIVGTGSDGDTSVPVVKKVFKKRVFVSRVAPDYTAEALYKAVKPKLSSSLGVVRMHTLHPTYSSFCLFVDEEDEKVVLSPSFWASGTLIKPFLGRLPEEKIHSRWDGNVPSPSIVQVPVIAAPNGMDTNATSMDS